MKERCVGAFARGARWLALAAVALLVSATTLHGQATGKLEGRVRDQAGAPIAGAQVRIEGTAFGAVADARGYYFINNVPAGTVDLLGQFVGYKPVRLTGLRILSGQTITQDIALEQTAVELTEIEVQAAQNVLVPRDAVTTKQVINGEYTEKLPVDGMSNVIALQPGVVLNKNGGLNIRGGRDDEAAVYIDGVPVTPGNRGGSFVGADPKTGTVVGRGTGSVDIATTSFEEASVTTGGASAEYGNAQSGIIAIQTKGGGSKWSGNVGYANDEIGGKNHSLGTNAIRASIGGPIVSNLTFNVSGDIEGNKSTSSGLDRQNNPIFLPAGVDTTVAVLTGTGSLKDTTYVDVSKFAVFTGKGGEFSHSVNPGIASNYGLSTQGARVPFTANSSYRTQGKLQYTYGTGNRLALTGLRSQTQRRAAFVYNEVADPQNLFANYSANNVLSVNWTQNLSKSADRALALEVYGSYQWDRAITGPLTRANEQSTRDPFGGFIIKPMDFLFNFNNFNIDNLYKNFRLNTGVRSPYDLNNLDQYQPIDAYRNNAYGVLGFSESGGPDGRISLYKENRTIGKANLDWQLDRYNRVKLGGEYTKYHMISFSSQTSSQAFSDAYNEKPTRYNAFIEDRLDLGDVVLVGGLRYDYFKSGASRPYYTDASGNRTWFPRISTMPGFDANNPTAFLVPDQSHNYLSPHVQVSFPVTERTNFRLSYAHQVQAPDFALILGGINTDLSVTNTNHVYGSDLGFGRTITFEFGIRHSFSDDMVLDISAYNKDKLADAAGRLVSFFDPLRRQNQDIRVITNADFGNTKGVDIRFDRRIGELFNGSVSYTFEDSKNTGSDPFTYINFGSRVLNALGNGNSPPPQAILSTNQSRPHNLAGQLALAFPNNWKQGSAVGSILENVGLYATFRFSSGTPFTRCPVDVSQDDNIFAGAAGTGGTCTRRIEGDYNGARLPMQKQFDLRLTKGFGIGGLDLTAYADVRNLFNFKNITTVFSQTNDIVNAQELNRIRGNNIESYANEAKKNGVLALADSSINLTFGGAGTGGCGAWTTQDGISATPNCIYLIRAEQRYGNGDGIFTHEEQLRAVDAFYYWNRGLGSFTGAPRRVRLGLEVYF
jgi:hypothetical protein